MQNSDGGISDFQISGQSLIKENGHNSNTIVDTDMKLGPVTKLDKRKKTTSKQFDFDVMSFFGFLANLEHSGSRIPDTESAKVTFSVIETFFLTNTEIRTKKSLTQLSYYIALSEGTFLDKKR